MAEGVTKIINHQLSPINLTEEFFLPKFAVVCPEAVFCKP